MAFGFSLDTGGLPYLNNYERALAYYEAVKPLRGSGDPGFRPLGQNRKNKSVWIKQDAATGDVIAGYYATDVLRYTREGTLIIDCGGHHTVSTADFINSVAPISASREYSVIWYAAFTTDGDGLKQLPLTDAVRLEVQEHGRLGTRWTVLNPDYPVVHSVSRKGATALRSKYREFRRYLSAVTKVQTKGASDRNMFDVETLRELFGIRSHTNTFGETLHYPGRPVAINRLGKAGLQHEFLPLCEDEATFIKAHAWLWHTETNYLAAFDRVLMEAFPETYFTEEKVTNGRPVKDQYAKYNR